MRFQLNKNEQKKKKIPKQKAKENPKGIKMNITAKVIMRKKHENKDRKRNFINVVILKREKKLIGRVRFLPLTFGLITFNS